jgi:hypothetical protein
LPSDRDNRPVTPIGFAGLSYLVSDVDDIIASATKRAAAARRRAAAATPKTLGLPSKRPDSPSQDRFAPSPVPGSISRWLWGGGTVFISLWIISIVSNSSAPSPKRPVLYGAPAPATGPQATTASEGSTGWREELPPTGPDRLLEAPQIRYCLSEDVRLDAARDSVTVRSHVVRFNSMVRDFNARCGNFRYRRQVLESVKREVEANRSSLQYEGIARFQR